jgi:septal ring factor EnvC (AmiA/AmiB activator)
VKTSVIHSLKLRIKNVIPVVFLFFLLWATIPSFALAATTAAAATPDVALIRKNLIQKQRDLADIQKKLQEEKKKQKQTKAKEKSVLGRLHQVDKTLMHLRRQKEANQDDLEETRRRLDLLRSDIGRNQIQLTQNRELLKQRLLTLYRGKFRSPLLGGILASESSADLTRKLKFEMMLAESNETLLHRTLAQEQKLQQTSREWLREQNRKQRILGTLNRQENTYSKERNNRAAFLSDIRQKQILRQKTIEELSQRNRQLQAKVALLLNQAKTAKKKTDQWYSSGTGLTVKRGRVPWPVSGPVISRFGKEKKPEFNATIENTGILIQASLGTPIHAVAAGLVRYADWFKGYGKLVILDHGRGYYSLYAQASELDVTEGQKVTDGQIIGTVGDTGSLYGSSLYFEIRRDGVPQDPERWLTHKK